MNKEELKELLAHAIVNTTFTNVPVGRVKSELRDKVIDVVNNWYQEPVKPELPKGVADEMENYKSLNSTFHRYLHDSWSDKFAAPNSYLYLKNSHDEKILATAWYNGYTVEKEPVYNLILGFDPDESDRRLCNALYKNHGELSIDAATDTYDLRGDDDYQFTQEEIDKYNKNFWIKNIDLNDYKVEVEE